MRHIVLETVLYLFLSFWLRWVFIAVHRLSLVLVSGGYSPVAVISSAVEYGEPGGLPSMGSHRVRHD